MRTATWIVASLLCACGPYGDAAHEARKHRRDVERRSDDMRVATRQTQRGQDLAGDALIQALSGKTLVKRYASFPNGTAGAYVIFTHYRSGGEYVLVDNWLQPEVEVDNADRWSVEGPRLCVLDTSYSSDRKCYRVARTPDGTLQFYIDQPGEPYDTLLTIVVREVLEGPPPKVESVLKAPSR